MTSAYAQQIGFASGILVAQQIGDLTPIRFGILQDASLEYMPELRPLYGQYRYAIALAAGKTRITVKSKFAGIRGLMYNKLFFAGTLTANQTIFQDSESHAFATSVTVTNSGAFIADEGAVNASTSVPYTAVASSPAVGQYSVSGGVYTFNAGETGNVLISYTYASGAGNLITFGNPAMGTQPVFSVVLNQPYDGRQQTWTLNRCVASRLSVPTKLDDYIINEFDFEVSQDISGNLGSVSTNL